MVVSEGLQLFEDRSLFLSRLIFSLGFFPHKALLFLTSESDRDLHIRSVEVIYQITLPTLLTRDFLTSGATSWLLACGLLTAFLSRTPFAFTLSTLFLALDDANFPP